MRITRHLAPDMRQALKAVKEQLGSDAVILSSRRTPAGVEITAAMDFDAEELRAAEGLAKAANDHVPTTQAAPQSLPVTPQTAAAARAKIAAHVNARALQIEDDVVHIAQAESRAPATARLAAVPSPAKRPLSSSAALLVGATSTTARSQPVGQVMQALAKQNVAPIRAPQPVEDELEQQVAKAANLAEHAMAAAQFAPQEFLSRAPREDDIRIPVAQPADLLPVNEAPASATELMGAELKTLRRMLETQLAQLAWNDLSRRAPIHTEMLRELTEIGLSPELAAQVVAQLPAHMDLTQARRLSIATLSQQVLVTGDRWLEDGGRVALVGPTGVGKTTTLAKLAVRWVLRHGARDLAIIAADSQRIGAHEQMNALGQLLGARVYPLQDLKDLPALLDKLKDARFVLIDTPGSSLRDTHLASRLEALNAVGPQLETALVLSANTQAGAIADAVQRFAAVNPASCLITKIDEAASLGGLLSVLVRARLPVSYMSEGQRVPEDLRPARSLELVSSAVQLAQTAGAAADEDLLRRRFGEMAHAIA